MGDRNLWQKGSWRFITIAFYWWVLIIKRSHCSWEFWVWFLRILGMNTAPQWILVSFGKTVDFEREWKRKIGCDTKTIFKKRGRNCHETFPSKQCAAPKRRRWLLCKKPDGREAKPAQLRIFCLLWYNSPFFFRIATFNLITQQLRCFGHLGHQAFFLCLLKQYQKPKRSYARPC